MDTPPPFTWYELWKDFVSGDLWTVMEKSIFVFQVPEECYTVTFSFALGVFLFLGMLSRMYPSTTIHIMKHLLGVSEESTSVPPGLNVTINTNDGNDDTKEKSRGRTKSREPISEEERIKKEDTARKGRISKEYVKFASAVLNILGKEISTQDKIQQIMLFVENLSVEAIIGHDNKNVSRSAVALIRRYHSDDVESGVITIG